MARRQQLGADFTMHAVIHRCLKRAFTSHPSAFLTLFYVYVMWCFF